MSLLETNITRKKWVDKITIKLEFETDDNEIYQVKKIQNSMVYVIESETGYLLGLYYLINWIVYLRKENI